MSEAALEADLELTIRRQHQPLRDQTGTYRCPLVYRHLGPQHDGIGLRFQRAWNSLGNQFGLQRGCGLRWVWRADGIACGHARG